MPRIATPLTDKEIQKAKPREKKYKLNDGNGLYLIINPKGTKSWKLDYKTGDVRKEATLGSYPVMTLKDAREKALVLKRKIFNGMDPLEEKQQQRQQLKQDKELEAFESRTQLHLVAEEWLELYGRKVSNYTAGKTRALLENNFLPMFSNFSPRGNVILSSSPIARIKHFEIVELLKEKAKDTEYTAKRLKEFLNRIWKFAVTSGYCEENIISKISNEVLPTPKVKHISKITDEVILSKLFKDIDNYSEYEVVKASLQFLVYTMLRSTNLVELKWEYIDFEKKILIIPREKMKVNDENLSDFTLPLVDQAIVVLEKLRPINGHSEYIFSINGKPINKESGNKALRLMGYSDPDKGMKQTQRSFRGTFRSLANTYQKEHEASYEAKEAVLDHQTTNKVEKAYTHKSDYVEQMRDLLEWYGNKIEEIKKISL